MTGLGLFIQIFWTFFLIGVFNFGGGGAMISLIQTQVITHHHWLTEIQFVDIVAISQATPGPIGINCATFTGYEVLSQAGFGTFAGVMGSLMATLAIVLPSFLIFALLIRIYSKFHTSKVFIGTMKALKPAVVGLIAAAAVILTFNIDVNSCPAISLIQENFPDWKAWMLFAGTFISAYFFKVNPIWLIIIGAGLGFLLY